MTLSPRYLFFHDVLVLPFFLLLLVCKVAHSRSPNQSCRFLADIMAENTSETQALGATAPAPAPAAAPAPASAPTSASPNDAQPAEELNEDGTPLTEKQKKKRAEKAEKQRVKEEKAAKLAADKAARDNAEVGDTCCTKPCAIVSF